MFKHIEDDGDINILVCDDGTVLLVCAKCKKKWVGQFAPVTKTLRFIQENFSRFFSEDPGLNQIIKDIENEM